MTGQWRDAVERGDLESIARQLDAGIGIDSRDEHNQTALMIAARAGQTAMVRLLVKRGAGLNHTAKFGLTALMLAVLNGHAEIVRVLVAAGADERPRGTGAPGFAGRSALDLAIERGNREAIDILRPRQTSQ